MKKTAENAPVSRNEDFRNNMSEMTWRAPSTARGWTTTHVEQPVRRKSAGPASGKN